MDDNRGGTPAESPRGGDELTELDELWEQFEHRLGDYLSTMVDPDEGDHLLLELPDLGPHGDGGCAPYAQFASFGSGRALRAEISGDVVLAPQHRLGPEGREFLTDMGWVGNISGGASEDGNWHLEMDVEHGDVLANHVAWALRTHFGLAHPELLTYDAWGPASVNVGALGLCASDEVPVEKHGHAPATLAHEPSSREELVELVRDVLRNKCDEEPVLDEDGDFVLGQGGTTVWVRVRAEQPAVEIMAMVGHDVRSRRATAVELGLLNRDNLWVRWALRGRWIWQTLALPGLPFVPAHLEAMLDLYLQALAETRADLILRTGARGA